jgi:hypothetical protein
MSWAEVQYLPPGSDSPGLHFGAVGIVEGATDGIGDLSNFVKHFALNVWRQRCDEARRERPIDDLLRRGRLWVRYRPVVGGLEGGAAGNGASPLHGSVAWGVAGESVDDVGVSANPIDGLVADVPHAHQESTRAQDAFDLSESGVVLEPVKRLGGNHGVD